MNPVVIDIPAGPVWVLVAQNITLGSLVVLTPEAGIFATYRMTGHLGPGVGDIWKSQRLTGLEADIQHTDPIDVYLVSPDMLARVVVYR